MAVGRVPPRRGPDEIGGKIFPSPCHPALQTPSKENLVDGVKYALKRLVINLKLGAEGLWANETFQYSLMPGYTLPSSTVHHVCFNEPRCRIVVDIVFRFQWPVHVGGIFLVPHPEVKARGIYLCRYIVVFILVPCIIMHHLIAFERAYTVCSCRPDGLFDDEECGN